MREQHSFRVEAIVMRHADWGEADRLLVIYTRQKGKLRAVVRGARKMHSRKAGHVEPFMHVSLQLAKAQGPMIVTDAEAYETFQPLREDLLRTGYAAYLVELVDRFTWDEENENQAIFQLLLDSIKRVAKNPDPWLAVRYYEMHLLEMLGFRPQLLNCVNCQEQIEPQDQFFSPSQGGVLCPRCGAGLKGIWQVTLSTLKYLRHLQRSNFTDSSRARPDPGVKLEMETLLQSYLTYLLERDLNSPGFIHDVRNSS